MAVLVIDLYNMGSLPESPLNWKNSFLPFPIGVPDVGSLRLGGTIKDSRGLDFGKPRVLNQWAFILLVKGRGLYRDVLGNRHDMIPGDWILVFPEVGHSYGPVGGAEWDEIFLCFEGPLFDLWRESQVLSTRNVVGHLGDAPEAWKIVRKAMLTLIEHKESPHEALAHWLQFLLQTCGRDSAGFPDALDPRLRKACRLIEDQIMNKNPRWTQVCRECGTGYENLRKLFRQHLDISPARYREQRRMEHALQLIQTQHYPAKKIAELLGYHDEAHFSRAFRRANGETFTQYKQRVLS